MIGELLGEVVCEIFGGVLELVWPERVRGFAVVAAWLVIGGLVWMATRWWEADPGSDWRTQLVALAWVCLPMIGMMLSLSWENGLRERKRMRRAGPDATTRRR